MLFFFFHLLVVPKCLSTGRLMNPCRPLIVKKRAGAMRVWNDDHDSVDDVDVQGPGMDEFDGYVNVDSYDLNGDADYTGHQLD